MPLGSAKGPFKQYRRLAIKRMEELGWLRVYRGHYNIKEKRMERPSWVDVQAALADQLAQVLMPTVPVERPEQPLHSLNRFLAKHEITGCPQVKLGFRPTDKKGNRYGRMHAACAYGMSYQNMRATDRAAIRFDDHPTVELDLGSSQIRILLSQMGHPLAADEDPYFIEGVARDAVKLW
jgi:hypothetical protein